MSFDHEGDVVSAIIRRGRLIVEDANSSGSESEDGGGNEGGDGGSGDAGKPKEVAWALPEGFELGTERLQRFHSMLAKRGRH